MSVKVLREANESIPAEILEFADKIDFDDLSNLVSKYLKVGSSIKLVPGALEADFNEYILPAKSKDIHDKCGIMSEMFESVVLELSDSGIVTDSDREMFFWCTPCFYYRMKNGDSNDLKIFTAIFTEKEGWKIE